MPEVRQPSLPAVPLPVLPALAASSSLDLAQTLQLVADTIVELLGFEVAVINLADGDESMVVAAVAGPPEVHAQLLNRRQGLSGWSKLVAASEPWGRLRFLDHAKSVADPADVFSWIPDMPVSDAPNAWHPEDSLFAPLESSDGRHLGMMSVDVPRDGQRPGPATRRALEAFAVTASLAIEHATLAADSLRSARRFQAVFDSSPVAVALLGPDARFISVNPGFCSFLARQPAELVGHSPAEFTHPDDAAVARDLLEMVRAGAGFAAATFPVEKRYLLPDGTTVWGLLHLAPLDSTGSSTSVVIAQIEDVTERKRAEQRLVQQAHFDALTGLPNRELSMRHLQDTLDADAVNGTCTAVFFCDLDRLKLVNDGHGHAVGDAYIREVSRRIRECIRESDFVGRLSGDEFVVILHAVRAATEAKSLARRVTDEVRRPLRLGGSAFTPSVSIGIASGVGAAITADELLAQADSAMYRAKLEERGAWQVYDPSMRHSAAALLSLRSDVEEALEQEQFVLHYQPIVRLSDHSVVGHEALLRWEHPTRGLLMPGDFLDVIVDSEYESPVTDWVLRRACIDTASNGNRCHKVTVNVSSLQVGRSDLPQVVTRCLTESGLEPGDLVLELTEDRLLSRADGAELLDRLGRLGVELAIDDFGTGYAGLLYLQRFQSINVVKLDRSFTAGLERDPISEHIIHSMVELTRRCGWQLVTEGVETRAQADVLLQLGVPFAQGYYFGRPQAIRRPDRPGSREVRGSTLTM
jgi:diguanylate cyclase (GGDEF)-like protein/PAS domain S-box-containing protein